MYRQYIIMNRGLKMSRGKLMAQAAHVSMAFLTQALQRTAGPFWMDDNLVGFDDLVMSKDLFNNWIAGEFGKVVLVVDSEEELEAIINKAKEVGFVENYDFFPIRDNCHTELTPDETGTRLTCVGFAPMEKDTPALQEVVGKLPLFR